MLWYIIFPCCSSGSVGLLADDWKFQEGAKKRKFSGFIFVGLAFWDSHPPTYPPVYKHTYPQPHPPTHAHMSAAVLNTFNKDAGAGCFHYIMIIINIPCLYHMIVCNIKCCPYIYIYIHTYKWTYKSIYVICQYDMYAYLSLSLNIYIYVCMYGMVM